MTTLNANPFGTLGTNSGDTGVGPNGTYSAITTQVTGAAGGAYQIGQTGVSSVFSAWETFMEFDTSSIGAAATITAESLSLKVSTDNSATDFSMEARTYDYGGTVDNADQRTAAQYAALTLLASHTTAGISTGVSIAFTENGTNLRSAINRTGMTRMIFGSDRWASTTQPTQAENVNFSTTAADTVLSVTYTNPPNAPTGLTATAHAGSSTQIDVAWTAPGTDATHDAATSYKVERAPDSGGSPGTFAQITSGNVPTSFADTGLTASTTYWYQVRATNAAGDGAYSSPPVSATTNASLPPFRPTRLQGSSNAVRRAATR